MDRQDKEWRQQRKQELRALKAAAAPKPQVHSAKSIEVVDCACVIHGDTYSWVYVEKLYSMISRNLKLPFRFHVYTEPNRSVPSPWIKHELELWPGFDGAKRAWWYKIQLFNPAHHVGPLLYFDLDTVIVNNIDWIPQLSTRYFWAIKEFKSLWRPTIDTINSSVMWWNTTDFANVWQDFAKKNIVSIARQYHGDQDYISARIDNKKRKFFDQGRIVSWRWQAHDGGYNFKKRRSNSPNQGTKFDSNCSILVFHGQPKPHEVSDPAVAANWI
jgi:hypothetical protein